MDIQYGEGRCRALLHLLFPEMNPTETFHIDHLHPKSGFEKKALRSYEFLQENDELMAFYVNPGHWNSIANLHLLNDSQNMSKKDKPLSIWLGYEGVTLSKQILLVNENTSLEFDQFQSFYEQRRAALKTRLKSRVFMTEGLLMVDVEDGIDEEVVEEELLI
ncbi:hypothetical protein [Marinomonas sp. CT5]|uniref:hypothetical protein n=1 Tax=Marinomonas sp. CT5 TaxID=2066133 RepID=UPI001BAED39E|nr:hypothetical protein [Marinomonas sp. CT5]